ncbi:MAG: hypothetical protein ACI9A7_000075 [Cyclobacteriaceae bacterium]|jgi:hypothetical protein
MSKEKSDHLYILIKSLRKSEKRYFKLRNTFQDTEEPKYLKLFNAIDKAASFNEEKLMAINQWINPVQFSNLKANLYRKILQSLKEYTVQTNDDISLREQIDYIQILFDRSLYSQSMLLLQKVKRALIKSENLELKLEVLKWEKNLIPYSLGKHNLLKVNQIIEEVNDINRRISRVNQFTNLAVELNAVYVKSGYMKNIEDYDNMNQIFTRNLPVINEASLTNLEKLLWYDIHVSYYNYIQDFEHFHLYSKRWVNVFDQIPNTSYLFEMYLKGLNHLMNGQIRLHLFDGFQETHKKLRSLANHRLISINENLQIRLFKYSYAHQFNGYFMLGDFATGVSLLRKIERRLEGYIGMLDKHSELVLFYKIASLYFGNENYSDALKWLNRIINSDDEDIREDVHSFARMLNLITHYELGNRDVIEYYVRSTYRYLVKKGDLHQFQHYILQFIKGLSRDITEKGLQKRFVTLREQLLPLTKNQYERRAFVYFDIISWLESKIEGKSVAAIMSEKALLVKNSSNPSHD